MHFARYHLSIAIIGMGTNPTKNLKQPILITNKNTNNILAEINVVPDDHTVQFNSLEGIHTLVYCVALKSGSTIQIEK